MRDSNVNVGGNVLESNGAWLIVRGVGLIASVDDVEADRRRRVERRAGLRRAGGRRADRRRLPRGVAGQGHATKRSAASSSRAPASTPRRSSTPSRRASRRFEPGLPPGVTIVPFYDRSTLIEQAVDTLRHALIEEIAAGHAGARRLPDALPLDPDRHASRCRWPCSSSFLGMYYAGISSNIMSLAGIAIAIGVLVDAGIVVTENAFRFIEQRGVDPRDRRAGVAGGPRVDAAGRPAGVLLDGDHPAGVHPGLRADRPGGQALPPAGLHQDVRRAGGDGHRRHARAGALQPAARRASSTRGGQPGDARAAPALPPVARRRRSRIASLTRRRRGAAASPARWSWRAASAASSCRRSTRAT